jgi:hypothetical protein
VVPHESQLQSAVLLMLCAAWRMFVHAGGRLSYGAHPAFAIASFFL